MTDGLLRQHGRRRWGGRDSVA